MNSRDTSALAELVQQGDFKSIARAITIVENDLPGADDLLKSLKPSSTLVAGVTGPPGAGKSTLINAFVRHLLSENKKVAIVAVDPTSPFNFGSLLADRLRMAEHFTNENIFIRSVATRGSLGGLSEKIVEITEVLKSGGFDMIIVETVGVGQSEVEVAGLADTTIVVLVPEAGDEVQAMKSGIMEIADVLVVNKADRPGAGTMVNHLLKLVSGKGEGRKVPVLKTVASEDKGMTELYRSIQAHKNSAQGNEKKIMLLAEKIYNMIRASRMKDISREKIITAVKEKSATDGFNIYQLAEQLRG